MIVEKEFLTKLKDFNLNSYESRLWVALLSRGVSTAGELSDIANVPRSRSYDVLESLQKKGFINLKPGKPINYIAVPPEEVLERRKRIVRDNAEKNIDLINEISSNKLLSELVNLHSKGACNISKEDLLGNIRGHTNIQNHIETMIKSAEKSIRIHLSANAFAEHYNHLLPLLKNASSRGISILIATQIRKENETQIKELSRFAVIRQTNKAGRLFIVDKREVLFMLYDINEIHRSYDIGVWVNSEYLANGLAEAFESPISL